MLRLRTCGLTTLTVVTMALGLGAIARATDTTYSAYGYGCKVDTSITGLVFLGHSGVVTAGAKGKSFLDAHLDDVVDLKLVHGSACAAADKAQALAGAANLHLFPGSLYALDCAVATSEARATSTGQWGRSQILGLHFGGLTVNVTGEANQTVLIPGIAKLVINEQKFYHVGDVRKTRVNALRLTVYNVGEIIVSAAEADINFVANSGHGTCIDFLSGCGRLEDGSHNLLDFSINLGIFEDLSFCCKTGCFTNGVHKIVLLGCSKYRKNGNWRHCEGPCSIDGVTGFTYVLNCLDGGDTPSLDLCNLSLSNGWSFNGHCTTGQIKLNIPCGSLALSL